MRDALAPPAARAVRWLDGVLAAVVLVVCVSELAAAPPRSAALTWEVAAVGVFGAAAVTMRRRWTLALVLGFSAACFFPGLAIGSRWWKAPSDALLLTTLILAYTLGAGLERAPALLGLIALCVGSSGGDLSDPVVLVVFTVPAWLAGTAMRAREQLTKQLAARAAELTEPSWGCWRLLALETRTELCL
jgi:hypothetical protein